MIRVLVLVEGLVGESLRRIIISPSGSSGGGARIGKDALYPLPLDGRCAEGLAALFHYNGCNKQRTRKLWQLCTEAWNGLVILGLNAASGHKTELVGAPNCLQKKVLEGLSVDCVRFVLKGLKTEDGAAVKCPEVPWSDRLPLMSVSYSGEIVDKARWLTFSQVLPGLPPAGLGGSLDACAFCDPWVRRHLECPSLSRIPDHEVPLPLPHAVVRATQDHWDVIAKELVDRGIATVIPEEDVATVNGEKVLNGAFGVVKPNRWIDGKPVLRLIMDFRAANALHRSLPGAVESLVGPAKWQAICLDPGEVMVASGDDLVSCFYLFSIPYEWSKYFAFRKTVKRKVLGGPGNPEDEIYIASRVIPMGWSAAVSVVQHLHRRMALSPGGLTPSRELHREKPMPEKALGVDNSFWNLYIDDFTLLETMAAQDYESLSDSRDASSVAQQNIRGIYEGLGVPYSKDKGEVRVQVTDKLGAHLDGEEGTLGISQKRAVELISLGLHLCGAKHVPTKWVQIFLGKFVHVMQFRRPLFCLVEKLWARVTKFSAGPLRVSEVDELLGLLLMLPLCVCDLRAKASAQVTASDASESGGGLTKSTGLAGPGRIGLTSRASVSKGIPLINGGTHEVIVIEWFAGIGGLTRSLERLGVIASGTAVCDNNVHCLRVLREFIPGCEQWQDITKVTREMIGSFLDRYPNAQGCIQGGGSPCQGLSQLSALRRHFEDERSGLFYELLRVFNLVKEECRARGLWVLSFVENVVCDEADQETFREETQMSQYLACPGGISHVRRPRFFWFSKDLSPIEGTWFEPGAGYIHVRMEGEKEPHDAWVAPGWRWVSAGEPVPLPTFTRSIPRGRPPYAPAGLHHTPEEARERWREDSFRYPPYTYKAEYCLTDEVSLRVCGASEREALMGFKQGHTAVKLGGKTADQDARCASVGNSFHTGVVSTLLHMALKGIVTEAVLPSLSKVLANHHDALRSQPKEVFSFKPQKHFTSSWDEVVEELEQQSGEIPQPSLSLIAQNQEVSMVRRLMEMVGYRGSDVHVDTLAFYRPDRLPRTSIDARKWHWKIVKGWRWRHPDHINVLEMEALYQSLRWRLRGGRLFNPRFLHLVDSQVVLGVVAKGRSSSKKLNRVVKRINLLLLGCHSYLLLGWVRSELNPADEPSRWFVLQ